MNNCILWQDYPENRRDSHAEHFTNFNKSLIYNIEVDFNLLEFLPKNEYPANPKTIGEHIRKRRMDLGLEQKEVARIIGVTESTIWNWENGCNPAKRFTGKIEGFLGQV